MVFTRVLVAGLIAALPLVSAAPFSNKTTNAHQMPLNKTLFVLSGPASYSGPWSNFPAIDTWTDYDSMFSANQKSMASAGSTSKDIERINVAIRQSAADIGVDERVILGIMMQESRGYVGVQTTYSFEGIATGGLMQCSGVSGYDGKTGLTQDQITGMISAGTRHYKANLQDFGDLSSPESIYPALREYNSGSVDQNDLSDGMGATSSYVSDVARRLQGWVN
ncbi:hypothetical protein F5Y15DRAFT_413723 [Xylariaceae sp. FL0016]|nr:hypothetical protein F5Y15DRAFT_413723 [Xylariaceae sp. FL0016]